MSTDGLVINFINDVTDLGCPGCGALSLVSMPGYEGTMQYVCLNEYCEWVGVISPLRDPDHAVARSVRDQAREAGIVYTRRGGGR